MELLGNSTIILYFVAGLTIICYENFMCRQKIILIYVVSYLASVLDIMRTIVVMPALTILLFIYLEYLTNDVEKLKIFKKFSYKVCDAVFLSVFQYHYFYFIIALLLQSETIISLFDNKYYIWSCYVISGIAILICVHKTAVGVFELETITDVMKKINKFPVFSFEYREEDVDKYNLIASIEDRSYFERKNSYNFISIEFVKYKCKNAFEVLKNKTLNKKMKASLQIAKKYIRATKHIRGYSTIEMQLIRNIALKNGYNLVVHRKLFELLYTKMFFSGLKEYFVDNYYSNRTHYKEYLIWLYVNVVQTKVNQKKIRPFCAAFENQFHDWSVDGLYVAVMGLSCKTPEWYYEDVYRDIADEYSVDIDSAREMYYEYGESSKLR